MSNRTRLLAVLAVASFACNKGSEGTAPPAQAPQQVQAPSQAAPASQPAAAAEPAAAPFSGDVSFGEGLSATDQKPSDVLFIMARETQEGGPGRLVAVQRHADVTFPMAFTVSPTDVMVPGMPFTGPFTVQARLDRDGDPMTRGKEDLYATSEGAVMAGQAKVALVLKKGTDKDFAPPAAPAPMMGAPGGAPPTGAAPAGGSMPAGHP